MSTNNHAPLRTSERRAQLKSKITKQTKHSSSMLLAFIAITWLLDVTVLGSHLNITKAIAIGGSLNWVTQLIFTWFVFRFSGAKAKYIVSQLYLGQIIKWLITIVGFALIFKNMHTLPVAFILTGYIGMQLAHFISLWQVR